MALSWLGEYGAVWLALGLAVALLTRRPLLFPLVAGSVVVAQLATAGLKAAVDRPRPPQRFPEIEVLGPMLSSASFPSGHAATSAAAAVLLALAAPRLAPAFLTLAAAVAWSRLYVGVHYPLDVLGGAALGALVATALLLLVRARRRSRP